MKGEWCLRNWRRYTQEFKDQAVARLQGCTNVEALARELNVSRGILYLWRDKQPGRPAAAHFEAQKEFFNSIEGFRTGSVVVGTVHGARLRLQSPLLGNSAPGDCAQAVCDHPAFARPSPSWRVNPYREGRA